VATRRNDRRTKAALADSPVQGLLADTQKARRAAGADELVNPVAFCGAVSRPFSIRWEEAPMAAGRDERRAELSPRDSAQNARPADAKTVC